MPARYSYAIIGQDSLQGAIPPKISQSLGTTCLVHVSAHSTKTPLSLTPLILAAPLKPKVGTPLSEFPRLSRCLILRRITCPVVPQRHMGDIPRHQSHLPLSQRNCVFSCAMLTGFALPQAHQKSGFSFRIQSTFSEMSLIKSGPVEDLSLTSIQ